MSADGWAFQWMCPLRSCTWAYEGTEAELKAAFLGDPRTALEAFGHPGGEIHGHIHGAHRVEEWVQELIDMQRERTMHACAPMLEVEFPAETTAAQVARFKEAHARMGGQPTRFRQKGYDGDV